MTRVGGLPLVAVVGRPNVGKSSLVNRILGRREAIVEEMPGVTRDRKSFIASWAGRDFDLMDTGGIEPGAQGLDARVVEQAQVAIAAADVVVLVVDGVAGPLQDDLLVADELRKTDKPVLLAVNKIDDPRDEPSAAAFHRLGLGDPVPFSALHGRGSGDLLDALVSLLPDPREETDDAWASIAIVGRPNVGKSSILNALLGEERSIVDSVAGTTRDPVDSYLDSDRGPLRIVDTAGMRREVQVKDQLEYYSLIRSRRALERSDVAVMVVDASEGVTGHDQRIAEEVIESGRACVIVLNKWDLVDTDEVERERYDRRVASRLRFLPWAPLVRTSALTGRGVRKILPSVLEAVEAHRTRLPTAEVNRLIRDAQARRPHPRSTGRAVKILYAVQASVAPPRFLLFTNARMESSYLRYLDHQLREAEPFTGTPLKLETRVKSRDKVKT